MTHLSSRLFFFLGLLFSVPFLYGQEVSIAQGGRVSTCGGTFTDSGGAAGDHAPSGQRREITICSDGSDGTHVQLDFTEIDVDGLMTVYNGEDSSADSLFAIDASLNEDNFVSFGATAGNTSGCLTVVFESEGDGQGWNALISCRTACQPIVAEVVFADPAPQPDAQGYIDVCPGEPITLRGRGVYPEAGVIYDQDDGRSTFTWNFQDGTVLTGPEVTHAYTEPGGYVVQLTITDEEGCTNRNRISQRVRVAPPPEFAPAGISLDQLCPGESISLSTNGATGGTVTLNPRARTFSFNTSQSQAELTEIPDNVGEIYSSALTFESFRPGQRLAAGADIVKICATLEHSFVGDLDIWVECPDGNRVDFLVYDEDNANVSAQTFGRGRVDGSGPEPAETYCWTATAPRTLPEIAATINPDSPDPQLPFDIDYRPLGSGFDALVGCLLNGEWTLNIRDNLTDDDGTIYGWSIEFASDLYPDQEEFTVPITSSEWVFSPVYDDYSPDQVVFNANDPGQKNFRLRSVDAYGCRYDTLLSLAVRSPFDPACFACNDLVTRPNLDTTICESNSFVPDLVNGPMTGTVVTWEQATNELFQSIDFTSGNPYVNEIIVANQAPATITNPATDISAFCIDLSTSSSVDEINIVLEAPDGRQVSIFQNSGTAFTDLEACFAPGATADFVPRANGAPIDTFQIDDVDWEALVGSPVNGIWSLQIFSPDAPETIELISWSIGFDRRANVTYTWSPTSPDFSCTDCPNPTITPTQSGTYTLDIITNDGCQEQATLSLAIGNLDISVTETISGGGCNGNDNASISLGITPNRNDLTFSWSNGATTKDITDLAPGDYSVSITGPDGCTQSFEYTIGAADALSIVVDEIIPVSCAGGSTGEIRTTTAGGTPPYTYLWDDPNAQVEGDAGALQIGTYNVIVTDANGCTATTNATVTEPAPLALNLDATPTTCRAGSDGMATVTPTGGNGDYQFAWQTGAQGADIDSLISGSYVVTVTDGQGCEATDSVFVDQPAELLTAQLVAGRPGCAGIADNQATVTAEGGLGGFTYLWPSGETEAFASALAGGLNTVTVTDVGGCIKEFSIDLEELDPIEINLVADPPSCNGASDGQMGAVATGGIGVLAPDYTYQWSTGDQGFVINDLTGGAVYGVTVTDRQGCVGLESRTLANPPPISFTVVEQPVTCFGDANGSLNLVDITGPNEGSFNITWGPNANSAIGPTVENLPAGSYQVTVRDIAECSTDTILEITTPEPLAVELDQMDVGCFGDQTGRIEVLATGGVGGYEYAWSNGSDQALLPDLPAGDYTLMLSDSNACVSSFTYTILQPDPIVVEVESTPTICFGEATGQIQLSATGGRPPFRYSLNETAFTRSASFIGLAADDYLTSVKDDAGCIQNTEIRVENGPAFAIELGPDTTLIFGDSLQFDPLLIGGVDSVSFNWRGSYEGTLSCTDCFSPLSRPDYEIDYFLSAVDGNGCKAEDRIRVSVEKIREVAVPTGFTPNDDGRNDRLLVHGRPGTRVVDFLVFDRWGGVVFEAADFAVNDDSSGWDGNDRDGTPLNAGVYLYKLVIEYEDESQETLSGQTTLIR